MYPTGGYGNFMYKVLTEFFENTVKVNNSNFEFSNSGNSHKTYKYTETFHLAQVRTKQNKKFEYNYQVYDEESMRQINQGKKLLVLADVGSIADNVNFIKKYFPHAKIIRIYAESFREKLVVWANNITKSLSLTSNDIYKTSLHTTQGIAKFVNKPAEEVNDQDAINCLSNFLENDFAQYGKYFSSAINKENVINFAIKNFFNPESLFLSLQKLAETLNTSVINEDNLKVTLEEFHKLQKYINLDLNNTNDPILGPALANLSKHKISYE